MASRDKNKSKPPSKNDETPDIDFSIIRTAIQTGGKMVDQIVNGIHCGSPEVRLLLQDECDIILECRVCRALFRGLPNFIAHKRVYCRQAYASHHSLSVVTVPSTSTAEEIVTVEPREPGEQQSARVDRHLGSKSKGGKEVKKTAGKLSADRTKQATTASKAQRKNDEKASSQRDSQIGDAPEKDVAFLSSHCELQGQSSERSVNDDSASGSAEQRRDAFPCGKSPASVLYSAAVSKIEKEKATQEVMTLQLTLIPTNPNAVFVSPLNSLETAKQLPACDLEVAVSESSSVCKTSPTAECMVPNAKESLPTVSCAQTVNGTHTGPAKTGLEASLNSGSMHNSGIQQCIVEKTTIKNMTEVVKELRQKKEERTKGEDQSALPHDTKSSIKITPSFRQPSIPVSRCNTSSAELASGAADEKTVGEPFSLSSQLCFPAGKEPTCLHMVPEGAGDIIYAKAVVKRCLTGQLGAVRTSPLKVDMDNSNDDYASSSCSEDVDVHPLCRLRKRDCKSRYESAMDVDNLRCRVCQMNFSRRRSLIYHCQTRHSGHRTIFPCPYCPGVFYYFWGLTRHLNTNHKKSHSEIDRMRKSLREKAYKQDVTSSKQAPSPKKHSSKKSPSSSSEEKLSSGNEKVVQRARPSLPAKKLVSAVKNLTDTSVQGNISNDASTTESKSTSLQNATTARVSRNGQQVEKSSREESVNIYRKVYHSIPRRRSPTLGNKVTRHSTLQSELPANNLNFEENASQQMHAHQEGKCMASASTKVQEESEQARTAASVGTTTVTAAERLSATGPLTNVADEEEANTWTDVKSNTSSSNTMQSPSEQPSIQPKSDTEGEKRIHPASNQNDQASLDKSKSLPTQQEDKDHKIDTVDTEAGACSVAGSLPEAAGSSVPTQPEKDKTASGLLHICTHCQRAFGRKISLLSHEKICRKVACGAPASTSASGPPQSDPHVQTRSSKAGGNLRSSESPNDKHHSPAQQSSVRISRSNSKAGTAGNIKEMKESENRRSTRENTGKTAVASQLRATPRVEASRNSSSVGAKKGREYEGRRPLRAASQSSGNVGTAPRAKSSASDLELSVSMVSAQPQASVSTRTSRPSSANLSNPQSSRESSVDSRNSDVKLDSVRRTARHAKEDGSSRTGSSRESSVESTSRHLGSGVREAPRGRKRQVSHTDTSSKPSSSRESSVESRAGVLNRDNVKRDNEKALPHKSDTLSSAQTKSSKVDSRLAYSEKKSVVSELGGVQAMVLDAGSLADSSLQSPAGPESAVITQDLIREISQHPAPAVSVSKPFKQGDTRKEDNPSPSEYNSSPAQNTMSLPQTDPSLLTNKMPQQQGFVVNQLTGIDQQVQMCLESTSTHLLRETEPPAGASPNSFSKMTRVLHSKATIRSLSAQHRSEAADTTMGPLCHPNQQASGTPDSMHQRPQRKRRAPSRIADSIEYTSGKDLAKKANLTTGQDLEESNSVPGVTSNASDKSKGDGNGRCFEEKDGDGKTVRLVEEIWVDKKPGRPSERVRSNRIYVVEPARAGRLTCQDTRKVGQIVDEVGLYCMQCLQKFTSISNLRRHAIRHLGWRRFKCRLCRFCSYNRSECNTHILRSHPERLRSCNSNARVESFITDLNRQAATVRSNKKRRTLIIRQGEESLHNAYTRPKSRRKITAVGVDIERAEESNLQGKAVLLKPEDAALATTVGHSENPRKPSSSQDEPRRSRVAANYFNISTRSSPRKFDTRPYQESNTMSHLYTRNKFYPKPTDAPSPVTQHRHGSKRELPGDSHGNEVNLATLDHISLYKKPDNGHTDKDSKTDSSGKKNPRDSSVSLAYEDYEDHLCADKDEQPVTLADFETLEPVSPYITLTEGIVVAGDSTAPTETVRRDIPVVTDLAIAERVPSPVQTFDVITESSSDLENSV